MIRATPDWWRLHIKVAAGPREWVLEPDLSSPGSRSARRSAGWRGTWPVRRASDDVTVATVQCMKSNAGVAVHFADTKFEMRPGASFRYLGREYRFSPGLRTLESDGRVLVRFRAAWTSVRVSHPPPELEELVAVLAGAQALYGLVAMPLAA